MKQKNLVLPLAIVGLFFFAIGFALGINSYLVPLLKSTLNISGGASYLLLAATFSAFLIFGYPSAWLIGKIGYKRTMAVSFLMFALGFVLFIPSARYESLWMFLLASFISGMGNTFLQASVNPYITICGPIESAARRMSIMGICNKLAWPVAPLFLAFVIGKSADLVTLEDIYLPFYIIIAVFLLLGVIAMLAPMPEVKAAGEEEGSEDTCSYAANKTSIWQFPHLILGCVTLFLYVGVETVALSTLVDYANELKLPNPENYAWISAFGMVIGYLCGIVFIPKYLSQSMAMKICASIALFGSIAVVLAPAEVSIWFTALMALGCSLMWPALWPLAMADLGKFTKQGASLLTVAIVGGAFVPTLFGFMKDVWGAQNAYWICVPCFMLILLYGLWGYKIRTKTA